MLKAVIQITKRIQFSCNIVSYALAEEMTMKLHDFQFRVGPRSTDAPECRLFTCYAILRDDEGRDFRRVRSSLVLETMLEDPEQIPWLIAHTLHSILLNTPDSGPIPNRFRTS